MSANASTRERVAAGLSGLDHQELEARDDMLTLRVPVATAKAALQALRDGCGFELCTIVTAVDHDEAPRPTEARFEVVWQLQSVAHGDRVRVKAWLAGTEPGADDFSAPTVVDLWPVAAYFERECFDMFGIGFDGHEGLRRLLMPEAYGHHPLRKEFPHGGIEPDRLYKAWDRERRQTAGGEA